MNYKVRRIKTSSGKIAVQVFTILKRKRNIWKHFGSANLEDEIKELEKKAQIWILDQSNTFGLFQKKDSFHQNYEFLGINYSYAYEFLEKIYCKFNFNKYLSKLLQDLIITRILEPGSKRDSLLFLKDFLSIEHSESVMYKMIAKYDNDLKVKVEKEIVEIAQKHFGFDFSFVLYDVTTLYFESFKPDEFKRPGFSKDHKHNQPQVVIGLIVTKQGFPISYQIFKGNINEGATFLPSILEFKNQYNIKSLTVVADSAMLSKQNLNVLIVSGLNYIISARLGNLKHILIEEINQKIKRIHGSTIRIESLIVSYSKKRYLKDKTEFDKNLEKANQYLNHPSEAMSRIKFLWNDKVKFSLDDKLIEKHRKLLGLKGYVTNLKIGNKEIVKYYHDLINIEHAFRIAKSDLEARPIYHFKEESIRNHILICFLALTISVYLELKSKNSIASIVKKLKTITDARILNKITGKVLYQRIRKGDILSELEKLLH